MNTLNDVDKLLSDLIGSGKEKHEIVSIVAEACLGWPYVFGAWGEWCMPYNRGKRMRDDHPTIKSKCLVLHAGNWKTKKDNTFCEMCQWGRGARMFDCRGFTAWLLRQVGLDLKGEGATSQYNTASNWVQRGDISDMPDVVCCVFKKNGNSMEHTGMHVGGGKIIHCSNGVQTGKTTDRGWTHYAIPVGLYKEVPTVDHPTLRKGSSGEAVRELQILLNGKGYNCGKTDGIFGAKTETAVKNFQKANGLTADGICGKKTWAKLEEKEPERVTDEEMLRGLEGVANSLYFEKPVDPKDFVALLYAIDWIKERINTVNAE